MKGHNNRLIRASTENRPRIRPGLRGAAGGNHLLEPSRQNKHLPHKTQAGKLTRAAYRWFSVLSAAWGRQPSVYLGLGGPAVEGMRLKPDAILLQTDGHRKPPRSELSPRSCCRYTRCYRSFDPGAENNRRRRRTAARVCSNSIQTNTKANRSLNTLARVFRSVTAGGAVSLRQPV